MMFGALPTVDRTLPLTHPCSRSSHTDVVAAWRGMSLELVVLLKSLNGRFIRPLNFVMKSEVDSVGHHDM